MPKTTHESVSSKTEDALPAATQIVPWDTASEPPPAVYVNHVQIFAGPWDVTLRLGQTTFTSGERIVAKELLRVILSPQSAKGLLSLLTAQVTKYEKQFGEIVDIAEKFGMADVAATV